MNPPAFACQRCGRCCRWPGHVLLEEADIRQLAARLGLAEPLFIEQYTHLASNRRQLSLVEDARGACVFLQPDQSCVVYEARPRQCRDFPAQWSVLGCPAAHAGTRTETGSFNERR